MENTSGIQHDDYLLEVPSLKQQVIFVRETSDQPEQ
jgi:hypothetical protein